MDTIRLIEATEAYLLRRAVLREGDAEANVAWAEDDRPGGFHLGCVDDDGAIVAVASFSEEPAPSGRSGPAWRLRGMAVAAHRQGEGLGTMLLDDAVARLRGLHARVLWCNARDTAMGFYERCGLALDGPGFTTDETGLPHHPMARDLTDEPSAR